ncbi:MAG: alcohol dehydrogenase [Spirochaetae bacterium HGW-Spirochaetae-1]|jgi:alcohol dehydrogenase|nr:MAG: alcohol dehydrogenase [Spirochaetae bacterium HGW-Spirochaetae-1]
MDLPVYYEFCNRVKTISGHKALEKIPEILSRLSAARPMIITDKGVSQAGLIKLVEKAVKVKGSKVTIGAVNDEVPPDSDLTVVNKLAGIYHKNKCDSIIVVGGGSAIDTAKGVNILVSYDDDNLMKYSGAGAINKKLKPLIAVPTTSGTGSEVTVVAVIADHVKNLKMLFVSYYLLPDVAILDSRMTKTLPPFLTAPTGMDALTHACEAYTCLGKNPISDTTALIAIRDISRNILGVVKKPNDLNGRLALANGANLAGMAFSNSMVGMVHTLGHSVGAVCHVPHGMCMSILLPYGLEYNLHKSGKYTGHLLWALAGDEVYAATSEKDRPLKAIEYIRGLNQSLYDATGGRHARCLKEITDRSGNQVVPKDMLSAIAKTAMGDGSIVYNPEELTYDDAMMVLEAAWEGTPLDLKKVKKSPGKMKV